ncbi:MAG: cytochrome c class I [Acidobacteria bacterium]|nr:MAG: cytochrome c class I [Acidobacteriota bacterium]
MSGAGRWGSLAVAAACSAVLPLAAQDWVAPPEERTRLNPIAVSADALQKGRFLYRKNCQRCHGEKGKGDGPSGRYGVKPPEDLTNPAKQAKLTDGEIFWKVSTGLRDGADVIMPAYKREIPADEDRWKVVLFVRTLALPPPSPNR